MDDQHMTARIATDVRLSNYSTMRLGGSAAYAVELTSRYDVQAAVAWADKRGLPLLVIGSGSNIVWRDEGFAGLLAVNKLRHYETFEEDATNTYVTIGAGENWDETVARTVAAGLTGIECLSLVPGTSGATPIQNVGAYGQDISQTLVSVEAYDRQTADFVTIPGGECGFGYRTSRFKTTDRDRFVITALTLHLTKGTLQPPLYAALQAYLDQHAITSRSPSVIRQAVIAIRSAKLPDPTMVANNGSFFANPVVGEAEFVQLAADYPAIPHWQTDGGVKLSAAWLLEQAGFKNHHDTATGMGTWATQPLVLVNERASATADLLRYRQAITDAVHAKFNVSLVQEPELLPAAL